MLNWIVWNRTVFDIGTLLKVNWIVWNRIVLVFNCLSKKTLSKITVCEPYNYAAMNCLKLCETIYPYAKKKTSSGLF